MAHDTRSGLKRPQFPWPVFSILFLSLTFTASVQAQVGFRLPAAQSPLIPLKTGTQAAPFSMATPFDLQGSYLSNNFRYVVDIDSTRQNVVIRRLFQEHPVFFSRLYQFNDYLSDMRLAGQADQWKSFVRDNVGPKAQQGTGSGGIKFETGKIKSETFKRLFGGETVSLNIDGTINIEGTMRHEKRSSMRDATNRPPSTNFQMKQKQRFKVTGKIGENISVDVEQDSENDFEFENAVKLRYSSDEDGIVKSVQAGNIGLSLPSTKFVTFSQQSSGLFGIKAEMQVGRLGITAIAGMEKGEKKTLSLSGQGETQNIVIDDYNYKKGTYFFLDTFYRDQYKNIDAVGQHYHDQNKTITDIMVYKSEVGYNETIDTAFEAWLLPRPDLPQDASPNDKEKEKRFVKKLEPNQDYFVNLDLGYIQMDMALQESEFLAVAYKTKDNQIVGDLDNIKEKTDAGQTPLLKLIKTQAPRPEFSTWDLEWKNVYDLRIKNITDDEFAANFDVKIYYKDPQGQPKESITVGGQARSFLDIFGFDKFDETGGTSPDNKIDNNPNTLNKARGEIIFPNLRPFDPNENTGPVDAFWLESNAAAYRTPAIYDTTLQTYIRNQSKFYIEVESSRRSPEYALGMNVIEGSEEISLNGVPLTKDIDYQLDYFSGRLILLKDEATDPSADIKVNYESQQMFSNSKKVMLGTRADYLLWEQNGQRSFIGGTLLFLDKSVMDKRIRLGKETPMRNLVWDLNTAMDLEGNAFTNWLNKISGLDLAGPSKIHFEAEIAQIIPNPNTLNNKATGDKDGVAYLDDFEGAKRQIPLGVMRKTWKPGAPPQSFETKDKEDAYILNQGSLVWYNPYDQIPINDIWPNRETTTNYGGTNRTHVMTLDFIPNPNDPVNSWAAIQRGLSAGYYNQVDSRFIEVWVQPYIEEYITETDNDGNEVVVGSIFKDQQAKLHIDLGQISEDAIPNNTWNTEDYKPDGGIRDTNLEPAAEDSGLDGIFGTDPPTLFFSDPTVTATIKDTTIVKNGITYIAKKATPYDFWDLNGDGIKQENEPWSYDDYKYNDDNRYQYRNQDGHWQNPLPGSINGTENNKNDGSTIYPDSEDLNNNSDVDLRNNFFRFSVDLNAGSVAEKEYLVSTSPHGWRLYRIPLDSAAQVVGSPSWADIQSVRVSIDGVEERTFVSIAEIELVANEWKYFGYKAQGETDFTENPTDDRLSLAVVNTHDNPEYEEIIKGTGINGVIDPTLKIRSKEQSLVLKTTGLEPGATVIARKELNNQNLIQYRSMKFFVHGGGINQPLGLDDSLEFFLRWGSDTQNEIYYEVTLPIVHDGWNEIEVNFEELSRIKLEKESRDTTYYAETVDSLIYAIQGLPTIRNVRWLIAGIKNNGNDNFTGQLWMDELRLSGVNKDKGMAMRTRLDFQVADLLSFNGEFNRKDADFHTINETSQGQGSDQQSYNLNGTLNLDRLLPSSLGIKVPITAKYARSEETPKYLPGSDILLNDKTASDSLLQASQTVNTTEAYGFRYSKITKSRNPLIRYIVDPISFGGNYTKTDRQAPQTGTSQREGYVGNFQYDLNLGDKVFFKPFKFLGDKGLLGKIANTRFFAPSRLTFKANGTDTEDNKTTAGGVESNISKALFNRDLSVKWKPATALQVDYTLTDNYDLSADSLSQERITNNKMDAWLGFLSSGENATKVSQKQNISTSFSPQVTKWFSPSVRYSTNYTLTFNPQQQATSGTGRSADVRTNLQVSTTFDPKKLISSLSSKSSAASPTGRRSPRAPVRRQQTGPQDSQTKADSGPSVFSKLLSGFGKLVGSVDPINITYTEARGAKNFGITGDPRLDYQLGWTMNPGVSQSENLTSDRSSESYQKRINMRSGFKIMRVITTNLTYNLSSSTTELTQVSRSDSRSAYLVNSGEDLLPLPSWSVTWNGLEKLPLVKKVIKTMTLNHAYDGKVDETYNGGVNTQNKYSQSFRPMIGVNATFTFGVQATFQYGTSETVTEILQNTNSLSRSTNEDTQLTLRYSKRGGLRLPFFKKKLDNNIDFSMTYSNKTDIQDKQLTKEAGYQIISETRSWSIKPMVSYSFTRTVQGGMHLEIGNRYNTRTGKTKTTAFGINATINLGR